MSRPVAMVTGATSGIGHEIARDLSWTHRVVAIGRDPDRLAQLRQEGLDACEVELTDLNQVRDLVGWLDRLDVVVHAAAICEPGPLAEATPDDWRRTFEVNVFAPAELTRLTLPLLRETEGLIVYIGSGAGTKASPGNAAYVASKHALKAIADVVRLEEAEHRVRVATVAPGVTATPMQASMCEAMGRDYDPEACIQPVTIARAVRLVVDAPGDAQVTDLSVRPRVEIKR